MDAIFHRRSIRRFTAQAVEPDKVELMLRAAMAAPSACNQQPWEYYAVTSRKVIHRLCACSLYAEFALEAPLMFVPCWRTDCRLPPFAPIDLSASVENLLLEADALGLGATWIGIAPMEERAAAVGRVLALPDTLHAFALIACGYPAEEKLPRDRYDPTRVHFIR